MQSVISIYNIIEIWYTYLELLQLLYMANMCTMELTVIIVHTSSKTHSICYHSDQTNPYCSNSTFSDVPQYYIIDYGMHNVLVMF